MQRVVVVLALQAAACGALASCAPPGAPSAVGGAGFIEWPGNGQTLVGATPQLLDAEFGQPALLRVDGAAQVWLYQAPACGLNLILYPDNAGTPRVAMAAPTDNSGDAAACSAVLLRAHADAGTSQAATAQPQIVPAAVAPPAPAAAPPPVPPPAANDGGAASDGLERAASS